MWQQINETRQNLQILWNTQITKTDCDGYFYVDSDYADQLFCQTPDVAIKIFLDVINILNQLTLSRAD